jgi:hypothetical protein
MKSATFPNSSMDTNIVTTPYTFKDIDDILELINITLEGKSSVHHSKAFWNWKHHKNPFGVSYGFCAIEKKMKGVVGFRMLLRWQFKTREGYVIQAVRAVDTVTHPDYRRRGIFTFLNKKALGHMRQNNIELEFNLPNKSTLPGCVKLGWKIAGSYSFQLKQLSDDKKSKKLIHNNVVRPKWNDFAHENINKCKEYISKNRYNVSRVVNQWEKIRKPVGDRTPRDMRYLKWRYGDCPELDYGIYVLANSRVIEGLAIMRPRYWNGLKAIMLTELFLSRAEISLGCRLLDGLMAQLKADHIIAHFALGTFERQIVWECGFRSQRQQRIVLTYSASPFLSKAPGNSSNWDLTLGDLELM